MQHYVDQVVQQAQRLLAWAAGRLGELAGPLGELAANDLYLWLGVLAAGLVLFRLTGTARLWKSWLLVLLYAGGTGGYVWLTGAAGRSRKDAAALGLVWLASLVAHELLRRRLSPLARYGARIEYTLAGRIRKVSFGRFSAASTRGRTRTKEMLDELRRERHLDEVELAGAPVCARDLGALLSRPRLRKLDLSLTQLRTVDSLGALPALESLSLAHTPFTDSGMPHVGAQTSLRQLDLAHTGITGAGLKHLHRLTRLRSLFIHGTKVERRDVKALKKALPGLHVLN